MGMIHEGHVVVIASLNVLEVDVYSGERCGDCMSSIKVPSESAEKRNE